MPSSSFGKYDVEYFKCNYCKDDAQINEAEGILGHSLECFYNHYIENHYNNLNGINEKLLSSDFNNMLSLECVNSIKSRVKNPYHLIDKIVRKILTDTNYKELGLDNYHLYFDDLLGFRLIMLYHEDWFDLHKAIVNIYNCDENDFTDKKNRFKLNNNAKPFIISVPEINIRNGDDDSIYKSKFSSLNGCHPIIKSGRYYRSIHYSVFHSGYCFEIQVRSVFDEAWGEIDHNLLYPSNLQNKDFIEFSKMLNRITGFSNEMSSYFRNVIYNKCNSDSNQLIATLKTVPDELNQSYVKHSERVNAYNSEDTASSASDVIDNILKGEII